MKPSTRKDGKVERWNPVCEKEINEASCGYCVFTISDKKVFVGEDPKHHFNGKGWRELKRKSIRFPAKESVAPLKAFAINSCKELGDVGPCKDIAKWRIKLDSLDSIGTLLEDK